MRKIRVLGVLLGLFCSPLVFSFDHGILSWSCDFEKIIVEVTNCTKIPEKQDFEVDADNSLFPTVFISSKNPIYCHDNYYVNTLLEFTYLELGIDAPGDEENCKDVFTVVTPIGYRELGRGN